MVCIVQYMLLANSSSESQLFNLQIFLREIISNASDALDKIRIMSLTDESVLSASSELTIKVKVPI